jgi:hypothetical protein
MDLAPQMQFPLWVKSGPSRPALSALTPDYREISVEVIGGEATYGKLSFSQLMPTGK